MPRFHLPSLRRAHPRSSRLGSLLAQVLAVNLLLVAAAVVFATIAVAGRGTAFTHERALVVFGLATLATLLGNWLLLHRRFAPLERLISRMESADLGAGAPPAAPTPGASDEVRRLNSAFARMMQRLEAERRAAGAAVIQAQERERRRIAHDLHDEVNQALTAVSLRLQATIERAPRPLRAELDETRRLATRAMGELLAIARQLRPAVLDDHGLIAALQAQVRDFGEQTGLAAELSIEGELPDLSVEQQLAIYRITQEGLSNIARHAGATRAQVTLRARPQPLLSIADDGCGPPEGEHPPGLGISGMRERALAAGARLQIGPAPRGGTLVELTL
jgi:two-component system sensor histidine kinase UhpB